MDRPPPDLIAVNVSRTFQARALAAVRALRLHQWSKNVLVALPILGAHRLSDPQAVLKSALAFLAFGLVASAVYVLNDIVDVDADRLHPRKRTRPFASGALTAREGLLLVCGCLVAGGTVASGLPRGFAALTGAYFLVALAYSLFLKRFPPLDVFVLAALYTARIYAGAFATGISVSEWLASFSIFLFVSLAFLKRASELVSFDTPPPGRGYLPADRESIFAMGTSAGYVSTLVLVLYFSSAEIRRLYPSATWLWALCPLVLYWMSHLWLRARRGEVDDDPLVFALRDKVTWTVGALGAILVIAATRGAP